MHSVRVQRLEVVETGRRRRWSEDEKLRIVAESAAGPRLVSATARRHGLSPSLLFLWRRQVRAAGLVAAVRNGFVPAVLTPEAVPASSGVPARTARRKAATRGSGCIEIVLACGRRVVVNGTVEADALARVLDVLERR